MTFVSVAELAWYTLGAFILAGACLLWISLEQKMMVQHKIVLGFIGAVFGGLALIIIGEWIHSAIQAKVYLPDTSPSASQKPELAPASIPVSPGTAPLVQNMTLSNEQKKQLIKSVIALKPTIKSIMLNRSSSTKNTLWIELGDVFNRAGFGGVGGSVQTGFRSPRTQMIQGL